MVHEPGAVLQDRYEIIEPIGQGGMGAVYKARDLSNQQVVALKQLRPDAGAGFENQEMLARFEGEWQLLRTLNHPRIPRMLDAFRIEDCGYYVMEFIEGKSLDQVMRGYKSAGRRFPEEILLQFSLQILDVLEYLHGLPKPLLHRDVKPQNIIVREADGELFLVDFGLAREGGSATTKTLVGTLGYAPLEQVKGHPEPRSDLYALGATMWHMLVGEQPAPFDIPPLATVRNDVHPALAEVVDRACQDNVNRRYANARKMEVAARQALQVLTGSTGDDQRYEQLYLEEVPEVAYQGPRPLDAKEFLLRTALASASFLLLMVVLYRVKHLVRQPSVSPTPTLSQSAGPTPEVPGPSVAPVAIPKPPPLDMLGSGGTVSLSPATPEMSSFFSLPGGWNLMGYAGSLGPGTLTAPPGSAGGLMLSREGVGTLKNFRISLGRTRGPVNFQIGLWKGRAMVVGITSTLEQGMYLTLITVAGQVSSPLQRQWNQAMTQDLDLYFTGNAWVLRDVQAATEVTLPGQESTINNVQLMIPPAVQSQSLGIHTLSLLEQ